MPARVHRSERVVAERPLWRWPRRAFNGPIDLDEPLGGSAVASQRRNGTLAGRRWRRPVRKGLALAGIATLLPWPTGVLLGASVAQAASVTNAAFSGGA